jgi:hypothetical protein
MTWKQVVEASLRQHWGNIGVIADSDGLICIEAFVCHSFGESLESISRGMVYAIHNVIANGTI